MKIRVNLPIITREERAKFVERQGGINMDKWTTPEEMARKKDLKKKLYTYSFPILAIIIGTLVTIASNGL